MTVKKKNPKAHATDWKPSAPAVPASFRRLVATIRIPSIAEEKVLQAAAEECIDLLEGARGR